MKTESGNFDNLLDDFFNAYYSRRPVNASFAGLHEYDSALPDYSEVAVAETVAEMKALLKRFEDFPEEGLSVAQVLDKRLAAGYLRTQVWEFDSKHFYQGNPCLYTGEANFGFIALFLTEYAPVSERVKAAIARMCAIPALLSQAKTNLKAAPSAWIDQALEECIGASYLFEDGVAQLSLLHGIEDPQFEAAAVTAKEAFEEFKLFLERELKPKATDGYACGADAFQLMMKEGHFADLDLDAYVAYAETQIDEALDYLGKHAADFGAKTSGEALAKLADNHPSIDEYYGRFAEVWQACRKLSDEKGLVTWPDFPIEYHGQPKWARKAAPYLYFLPYRSPAPFNRPPVHFYLVPPIEPDMPLEKQEQLLRMVNDSVIKSNHVVHHGSIGHHVQNWNAYHSKSRIGQMAATDCASRLAMFCGGTMAEGWAVYVGDLMAEAGFLTPLEEYAEHQSRRRMSARAVVDIQLHRGAFSLAEAAEYYQNRGGMNAEAAKREAVKNSMFPGAAMMYLFGSDLIKALRKDVAEEQGKAFNLQKFHDEFLSYGAVPVTLICKEMKRNLKHD